MKKLVSIILALCILLTLSPAVLAASDSGTYGNLTWTVEGSTLTIEPTSTSPVSMPNYCYSAPWHAYNRKITKLILAPGVGSIGSNAFELFSNLKTVSFSEDISYISGNAFYNCSSLTEIDLPENVGYIYYDAFRGCTSLKSVDLPRGAWLLPGAFSECTSLTAINAHPDSESYSSVDGVLFSKDKTILQLYPAGKTAKTYSVPATVTSIGESAFYMCENLSSVVLPSGLTEIDDYAFCLCSSLTSVSLPDSLETIGSGAFSSSGLVSVEIPDSVTYVGGFYNCTALKSVTLPDTLDSMPSFEGCISLVDVNFPSAITDITNNCFMDCVSLKSVDLPEGLEYIADYAFYNCSSLKTIHIPASVTQIISLCTFAGCTSLESITVAKGNPEYCSADGVIFDKDKTTLIAYPAAKTTKNYTIPSTVENISMASFGYCSNLEKVTIPAATNFINAYAFEYATSIKNFVVDSKNETYCAIDGVLFWKDKTGIVAYPAAKAGTSYSVPEGTEFIEYLAFSGSKLTTINLPESFAQFEMDCISGASKLSAVNVDADNPYYASVDGVVFSKDKTSLIGYPQGRTQTSYTVPDSVEIIYGWSFYMIPALRELIIPEGVTSISDNAITECYKLTALHLPSTITDIEPFAVSYCDSLSDVYYRGNVNDWDNIRIDYGNDQLLAATMHYVMGQLTNTDCTKQGSVYRFNIHCEEEMTDELIAVATYDTNGNMTGISLVPCDGSWSYSTDVRATGNENHAKVFIWNYNNTTPLTTAESVDL